MMNVAFVLVCCHYHSNNHDVEYRLGLCSKLGMNIHINAPYNVMRDLSWSLQSSTANPGNGSKIQDVIKEQSMKSIAKHPVA